MPRRNWIETAPSVVRHVTGIPGACPSRISRLCSPSETSSPSSVRARLRLSPARLSPPRDPGLESKRVESVRYRDGEPPELNSANRRRDSAQTDRAFTISSIAYSTISWFPWVPDSAVPFLAPHSALRNKWNTISVDIVSATETSYATREVSAFCVWYRARK